ncbi:pentapeptide repeat-containing protein [bacterium]|nr:pentapeptide repeat-containing protein [bacterium]
MLSKEEWINILNDDIEKFNSEMKSASGSIDLSETDFSNINLEGAVFDNVDLTSSSFADSHLTEVKFEGCDLTSVDFTRANLVECSFTESVLNGTDFSYTRVDYGNFSDADMAGAVFQGADLTNSDFSMSENLSACRFDEETVWPDNEYLPEDFDTNYSSDLSSLKDDDDYEQSDY